MISQTNSIEKLFHQLAQSLTDDVFWVAGCDGAWRFISPAYESISGRSAASLYHYPKGWLKAVHPEDRPKIYDLFLNRPKANFDEEFRILHTSGELRWCRTRGFPIKNNNGDTEAFAGVVTDISRYKTEGRELPIDTTRQEYTRHAHTESEQRFRNLVETTSDCVWEVDRHAAYTYVSPRIYELLGYRPEEIIGITLFDLMPPDEARRIKDLLNAYAAQKIPFINLVNTTLHKNGHEVILETSAVPYFDRQGEFQGYRGINRDITERKEAQRVLKEALYDLHAIMNSVQDIIIKVDLNGGLLSWNVYTEKVVGYSAAELYGRSIISLVSENDRHTVTAAIKNAIESGRVEAEVNIVHKNGGTRLFQCIGVVVKDECGNAVAVTGVGRDITEQRKAERALQKEKAEQEVLLKRLQETQNQLLQSEKLASLGQLAAGVAHEINNPVSYINSNVGTLKQYIQELFVVLDAFETMENHITDQNALEAIRGVKQGADLEYLKQDIMDLIHESQEGVFRVRQIVQDLKDFSHMDEGEWSWSDLHAGMDSTLNIVHNELKYKAQVVKEYGDLPRVECLPSQINQVFLNLLVNAAHAIEDQGVITVRTGIDKNAVDGNEWVWVQIADTGKGIAPEHVHRIFDPFFTTKPLGQGTGLGLSVSYSIVEKHGGRIELNSELGRGSTFTVRLPLIRPVTKMAASQ